MGILTNIANIFRRKPSLEDCVNMASSVLVASDAANNYFQAHQYGYMTGNTSLVARAAGGQDMKTPYLPYSGNNFLVSMTIAAQQVGAIAAQFKKAPDYMEVMDNSLGGGLPLLSVDFYVGELNYYSVLIQPCDVQNTEDLLEKVAGLNSLKRLAQS